MQSQHKHAGTAVNANDLVGIGHLLNRLPTPYTGPYE